MRAVMNTGDGIRVVDAPEPDGDGVRLSVACAGIGGTDINFAAAGISGFIFGREFAGVDDGGTGWFVEPAIYGGECEECRGGNTQRCTEPGHGHLGVFRDGGMAERVVIPEYTLLPLPDGLEVRDACLIQPGALAWHGIRLARIQVGERLLVVGGGAIGLMGAAAARYQGIHVDVEARYDHQSAVAERFGAGRPGSGYDVVLDAAGTESSLARSAEAARPGGRIVSLGVFQKTMPAPGVLSLVKELTYINSIAYGRHDDGTRDTAEVAAMLAANPDLAKAIITHRYPLADAAEAFRVAAAREAGAIKVVIEP